MTAKNDNAVIEKVKNSVTTVKQCEMIRKAFTSKSLKFIPGTRKFLTPEGKAAVLAFVDAKQKELESKKQ